MMHLQQQQKRIDEGNAAHRSVPRAKVFSMAGKPLITSFNSWVSIEAVRRRLGHASTETTQLYTLLDDKVADAEIRATRRRRGRSAR